MKLQLPAPVTIFEKPFSMLDMARHITSTDPRFNKTADAARAGARIVGAIAEANGGTAELLEEDLRLFASVVEQPQRGWGAHVIKLQVPLPQGGTREMERKAHAPTAEYLTLIDAVAAAASKLPPLPQPTK